MGGAAVQGRGESSALVPEGLGIGELFLKIEGWTKLLRIRLPNDPRWVSFVLGLILFSFLLYLCFLFVWYGSKEVKLGYYTLPLVQLALLRFPVIATIPPPHKFWDPAS